MEAVISLHNRYSDRVKRAKSRIKFLVDKFGPEGFVEKYREELARTKAALATQDYPKGEWSGGAGQRSSRYRCAAACIRAETAGLLRISDQCADGKFER